MFVSDIQSPYLFDFRIISFEIDNKEILFDFLSTPYQDELSAHGLKDFVQESCQSIKVKYV